MPWLDIYMTVALGPAICLALLACIWLLRWAVKIARTPDDELSKG